MEREITLEELSDRHPGVEKDVNRVTFEVEVPTTPSPPKDGSRSAKRVLRDLAIGIVVGVIMIFLSPYVAALVP